MEKILQAAILENSDFELRFLEQTKILLKQKATKFDKKKRTKFARAFCYTLLNEYWKFISKKKSCNWSVVDYSSEKISLDKQSSLVACEMSKMLSSLSVLEAGNYVGTLYAALLPDETRSEFGVYYTPPVLVHRLIKIINDTRFNWTASKILDPACGGAAFLAPIADKIVEEFYNKGVEDPKCILDHIEQNLRGIEIDPFAAWISAVLLETTLLDLCIKAKRRLSRLITVADTLEVNREHIGSFDLIVGNPPYGKMTLREDLRLKFSRSLYGHANLYGVFTDIATQLINKNGLIAYVTPTSFLGGQYFKGLRRLLSQVSPPLTIDFIDQRSGVFDNVLQETLLVVYKDKNNSTPKTIINAISLEEKNKSLKVEKVGVFSLPEEVEDPWLFPRSILQREVLGRATKMNYRLKDYGYIVNTGQLVWNRHKEQLREIKTKKTLPIIWSESILENGTFEFKHSRKNHIPYIELENSQDFLITKTSCILVQRTTAKEQARRVMAAIMPQKFLNANKDGVVVENHINMIKPTSKKLISLKVLLAILNSDAIDQIFRCINGSVAVSAYELNALPLPDPEYIHKLGILVEKEDESLINTYITQLYKL
jgi:adenine-specific DNA-methyltransferase